MSQDQFNRNDPSRGGGRGRQGLGNAFVMSLIRQIARSLGTLLVRILTGGRR
jgi:hypothetical protein